jgi:hypothetical protein
MRQFKALRAIAFVAGFMLVAFGCATSNSHQSNTTTGLKAEAVPEGIALTFDNIPPEATRLFVQFQNWDEKENPAGTHAITASHSDIRGSSLEQVKQTGRVIFPFVKAGQKYHIPAVFQNGNDEDANEDISNWIYADCVPYSGIYFAGDIELALNEACAAAALSREPQFSSELSFYPHKYSYDAAITINESETLGITGNTDNQSADGLSWIFESDITEGLKETHYLEGGDYPVYVRAGCNVIYDNLRWDVEIAKSRVFAISL